MVQSDQGIAVKVTLDKDLEKLAKVEEAASFLARELVGPGLALLFLGLSAALAAFLFFDEPNWLIVAAAAAIGGYMALNIGANDIANNVGPAVGARAMTMVTALAVTAIAESAGALIAGGDVVETISRGIIDPALMADSRTFVAAMMAALLSSALWINLATLIGAPVSTTHAIVGGVLGAGIAASGVGVINWESIGAIAASWALSPIMGAVIAAAFLAFIKAKIIYVEDKIEASRRWVPLLLAIMAGAFATYLALKGFTRLIALGSGIIMLAGVLAFLATYLISRPLINRTLEGLDNSNQSVRRLFHVPLICSAALLSFAHGANDVANAVGPLAAIVYAMKASEVAVAVTVPLWVMIIGAFGISFGLLLFGPRLIRMVGEQITKLNPMRAFCIALSAAITVIVASWFGMPVSSTHIAVGAVFGVGFYREWYTGRSKQRQAYMAMRKPGETGAAITREREILEAKRRKLVRRAHVMTIIAAWVITVPASAGLAGGFYWLFAMISGR